MTSISILLLMFLAICNVPEEGSGALQYPHLECFNTEKSCGSAYLRARCYLTRWKCRDLGHNVANDTAFPMITGRCDEVGPKVFCRSQREARDCKVGKSFCNNVGYHYSW